MAIFPLVDKDASSSEYEMDMNLLQNGVVTDMNIRYADFAITQKLKALSANERPACGLDSGSNTKPEANAPASPPAAPVKSIMKKDTKA